MQTFCNSENIWNYIQITGSHLMWTGCFWQWVLRRHLKVLVAGKVFCHCRLQCFDTVGWASGRAFGV